MCHKLYTYTLTECENTYMAAASYFSNAVLIDGDFSSVRSQLRLRSGVCSFFFTPVINTNFKMDEEQMWKGFYNKIQEIKTNPKTEHEQQ